MADQTHLQFEIDNDQLAEKRRVAVSNISVDGSDIEPGQLIRDSDFRKRQIAKGWTLLWLTYQATGVIYGDIGTSPLYVYSSTFASAPSRDDVFGAVSLIIWTLTLIVSIKYAFIVVYADDEGEGGTFAVFTLLSRYCNLGKRDSRYPIKVERHATNELRPSSRGFRRWLERSTVAHVLMKAIAVLGVSLLLADGVLTPAQSVLGAIQGLEVAVSNISNGTIVGVSCAILVVLFVLQPLGIHRISSMWAPIVIIWLVFNGVFGIYNLAVHDHTILKAFSPYFAGEWFVRNKTAGWLNLGGILLAFTGVETLFADMGAFSRKAVQISWFSLAYPCLLLAYIGQGAFMLDDPSAYDNPFFKSVPPGMFYPSLVFAILAAVVASQATITGCFQLLTQLMTASYFPHLQLKHTSDTFHGQVYIPFANWLLMVGTVIVTAVYNNTTSIGHAYGTCVVLVTFITTNMVAIVAIVVWRRPAYLVLPIWLIFVTLDGLYLSSALTKVPSGAWFTIMLAGILGSFFTLWRYGKETQWNSETADRSNLSSIIVKSGGSSKNLALASAYGGMELAQIDGFGIFLDKNGSFTPDVYKEWLRKFHAQPDVVVLLHMRALSYPFAPEDDRIEVMPTTVHNVYRVLLRHGYNERVVTPGLGRLVYEEVRKALASGMGQPGKSLAGISTMPTEVRDMADGSSSSVSNPTSQLHQTGASDDDAGDAGTNARLAALDRAYGFPPLYVAGNQRLRTSLSYNIVKRVFLDLFLWVRDNTGGKIERWNLPIENLVQVGFVREL